jgi:hypothetical protein
MASSCKFTLGHAPVVKRALKQLKPQDAENEKIEEHEDSNIYKRPDRA